MWPKLLSPLQAIRQPTLSSPFVLTNCPETLEGKPVVVKYDGTPDATNNDYLQLTDYGNDGVAKGVANSAAEW